MRLWTMAALGTAVVAVAVPVLVPVALVLGVLALRKSTERRSRLVAWAAVGLALLSAAGWCVLILVGRDRVKQVSVSAECAAGLQSMLLAQERFRAARNRFADESELGLTLPASSPAVFQIPKGPHEEELKGFKVGRTGACPDCQVVLACRAGEQWWTISSAERVIGERPAVAGVPFRH